MEEKEPFLEMTRQMTKIHKMELEEVEDLPNTLRGKGGFGSTGK